MDADKHRLKELPRNHETLKTRNKKIATTILSRITRIKKQHSPQRHRDTKFTKNYK